MRIEVNIVKTATSREIDHLMTELVHHNLVETARLIHHSTVLPIPDGDRAVMIVEEEVS